MTPALAGKFQGWSENQSQTGPEAQGGERVCCTSSKEGQECCKEGSLGYLVLCLQHQKFLPPRIPSPLILEGTTELRSPPLSPTTKVGQAQSLLFPLPRLLLHSLSTSPCSLLMASAQ